MMAASIWTTAAISELLNHDHFCADLDPAIEVDDVLVAQRMQPDETCVPMVQGASSYG
jgi:hypothetical protein